MVPSRTRTSAPTRMRALTSAVLGLALMFSLAAPVQADQLGDIREDQRTVQSTIESTLQALTGAKKKIRRAVSAAETALAKLKEAKAEQDLARARATKARLKAEQARVEAAYAESALALASRAEVRLERKLNGHRENIDDVARTVYQQGPFSEMEVLLGASDPADFTARMAAVNYVSREQQRMERTMLISSADLVKQEVKLNELSDTAEKAQATALKEKAVAQQALAQAKERHEKVKQLRKKKKKALANARQYKGQIAAKFERLKREERKLQIAAQKAVAAAKAAAKKAAARQAKANANNSQSAPRATSPTGDLTWPLPGHNKSGNVGPRIHPIYGHNSCHTGIDIGAPSGSPVKAAGSGSVATITNGGPYGLAVMLVHSDGLTTFYAHLSATSVSIGQQVNAGDEVGKVGSTGWSTGPHLHFETRLNGTPYDPMGWFGGSRVTVNC